MYGLLEMGLLCAVLLAVLLTITLVAGVYDWVADYIEEANRRRLAEETFFVKFRRVPGRVAGKQYHDQDYNVTVLVGQRTYLTLDDENEFYRCQVGETVTVRVREHYDRYGRVFARAVVKIFHS